MSYDDEQDEQQQQLKRVVKQIEVQLNTKLGQFYDQLRTLVSDIDSVHARLNESDKIVNFLLYNQLNVSRYVSLIAEELSVFEKYASNNDPALRIMLADIERKKQEEIRNIQESANGK